MQYFELKLFIMLKKDLQFKQMNLELSKVINQSMLEDEHLKYLHQLPLYKFYVYSGLYPVNQDVIKYGYKANSMYMFDLRTIDQETAVKFKKCLQKSKNDLFEVINVVATAEKQQVVRELYTVTPTIATFTEENRKVRHWTEPEYTLEQIVERINQNAIKKYQEYMQEDVPKGFAFVKEVTHLNKVPIVLDYKNEGKLFTNKFQIKVKDDALSQKIAWFVMGSGVLEKNSLGLGFCKARK